ncbi:hypothetical protein ABW21_db0205521 [Orbilia brochopaga]|nr:hypothetical protein ABW21_db0205521 [Drechslerella brochopaga]
MSGRLFRSQASPSDSSSSDSDSSDDSREFERFVMLTPGRAARGINLGVPDHPFPFLRLPREIRDEVYKYLLIFDTESYERYSWSPCPGPQLYLSILRVNNLIHDEASQILDSDNIFPIHITISEINSKPNDENILRPFRVLCDSFWEDFTYKREADLAEPIYYERDAGWTRVKKISQDQAQTYPLPAPRYRNLVRRIRLFIRINRFSADGSKSAGVTEDDFRHFARTVSMPLARRLRDILGHIESRDTAHIELRFSPKIIRTSEDIDKAPGGVDLVADDEGSMEVYATHAGAGHAARGSQRVR